MQRHHGNHRSVNPRDSPHPSAFPRQPSGNRLATPDPPQPRGTRAPGRLRPPAPDPQPQAARAGLRLCKRHRLRPARAPTIRTTQDAGPGGESQVRNSNPRTRDSPHGPARQPARRGARLREGRRLAPRRAPSSPGPPPCNAPAPASEPASVVGLRRGCRRQVNSCQFHGHQLRAVNSWTSTPGNSIQTGARSRLAVGPAALRRALRFRPANAGALRVRVASDGSAAQQCGFRRTTGGPTQAAQDPRRMSRLPLPVPPAFRDPAPEEPPERARALPANAPPEAPATVLRGSAPAATSSPAPPPIPSTSGHQLRDINSGTDEYRTAHELRSPDPGDHTPGHRPANLQRLEDAA